MRVCSGRAVGAAYIRVMPRVQPGRSRVMVRMCPRCGYDGAEMQGEAGRQRYECPSCRGDLYTRPPRSYAEMEGLDVSSARAAVAAGVVSSGRWSAPVPARAEFAIPAERGAEAGCSRGSRRWREARRIAALAGLLVLASAAFAAAALLSPG